MVLVNIEINENEYSLVNIYAPNKVLDRIAFFKTMKSFIDEHALNKNRLFIGGDFNCVLTATDRSFGITDKSMYVLKVFVKAYSLVDAWKDFNPNRKEYTFIDSSFRTRNSRIDFIFCSRSVKPFCVSSSICQAPAPDHKAVCLHFRTYINTRGKGYWKFNNSVLKDEDFVCGVKEMYLNIVCEYGDDVPKSVLWDYMKLRIKEYSVTYCIRKAQVRKDTCKELQTKLDDIDK
jgi:hypothetical protein